MTKIVYNACHGGFSLSEAGVRRYAELKGLPFYVERGPHGGMFDTYWTIPAHERPARLEGAEWYDASLSAREAYNAAYSAHTIQHRDIPRIDPALVQTVEELGEQANGRVANLAVAEVASGSRYRIDEYDGFESVMTVDDYEWSVA